MWSNKHYFTISFVFVTKFTTDLFRIGKYSHGLGFFPWLAPHVHSVPANKDGARVGVLLHSLSHASFQVFLFWRILDNGHDQSVVIAAVDNKTVYPFISPMKPQTVSAALKIVSRLDTLRSHRQVNQSNQVCALRIRSLTPAEKKNVFKYVSVKATQKDTLPLTSYHRFVNGLFIMLTS